MAFRKGIVAMVTDKVSFENFVYKIILGAAITMASEETVLGSSDDATEGEGIFFVTQILPVEPAEELRSGEEGEEPTERTDENCTYQLGPTITVKPKDIVAVAERILGDHFRSREYSATEIKESVLKVSSDIRDEVKRMGLDRYRVVCQVTVGEKCNQDVAMTFLCLWKHDFDHYAVATYDGVSFFATALVFVVYKQ